MVDSRYARAHAARVILNRRYKKKNISPQVSSLFFLLSYISAFRVDKDKRHVSLLHFNPLGAPG